MPNIFITADHAGYALKEILIERIRDHGYTVEDMGPYSHNPDDDYPDFVTPLAKRVADTAGAKGIVIGGSGQGEAMCANRVHGIRASVFYGPRAANSPLDAEGSVSEDGYDAIRLPRRHNDANVLSLAARFMTPDEASEAVRIFLETPFTEIPRHARRIAKF